MQSAWEWWRRPLRLDYSPRKQRILHLWLTEQLWAKFSSNSYCRCYSNNYSKSKRNVVILTVFSCCGSLVFFLALNIISITPWGPDRHPTITPSHEPWGVFFPHPTHTFFLAYKVIVKAGHLCLEMNAKRAASFFFFSIKLMQDSVHLLVVTSSKQMCLRLYFNIYFY